MKPDAKSRALTAAKVVLILLVVFGIVFFLLRMAPLLRGITVQDVLRYTPKSHVLAGAVLILAYGVKSLTVFFPVMVLYLSAGILFPAPVALGVNLAGLGLMVSLPYLLGKWLGAGRVAKLERRYPKMKKLGEFGSKNELYLSFFTRAINVLPGDLVSLFLGASGIRYRPFLIGSLLGLIPVMIPTTLMGDSLDNPLSPKFWLSVVAVAAVSFGSMLLCRRQQNQREKG